MILNVVSENNPIKIRRLIKALRAVIPLDTEKDKKIHMDTLISLNVQKVLLDKKALKEMRAI